MHMHRTIDNGRNAIFLSNKSQLQGTFFAVTPTISNSFRKIFFFIQGKKKIEHFELWKLEEHKPISNIILEWLKGCASRIDMAFTKG